MKNEQTNFGSFLIKYLNNMVKRDNICRTSIIKKSGLSRPLIYRWMSGECPRMSNLDKFFVNTYKKGENDPDPLVIKQFMGEAYLALLLDFYEKKEQAPI